MTTNTKLFIAFIVFGIACIPVILTIRRHNRTNLGFKMMAVEMLLAVMAFLTIALSGRIGAMATRLALPAFVLLGVASVIHWHLSEQNGAGDLRLYLFVQFFPMLLIPLMLLLFPPRASPATDGDILAVMGLYGLALIGDRFLDHPLFALGGVISGHSLKHLIASLAVFWLLRGLRNQAT